MDGEIEIMEYPAVRELVARLERERDEARAALHDWQRVVEATELVETLKARIAALERLLAVAAEEAGIDRERIAAYASGFLRLERERNEARAAHDALWTEVSTGQTYARLLARTATLEDAAAALVAKLDVVQPGLERLALFAGIHGMPWKGPTFGEEREALRALLAPEATPPDDGRVP